ncbi:MAG TPA: PhzF family phenazine biosynthesis protein [Thermoanaerobaculia bacterium]|nr:PhzF family phenazine biosynthesis protein [Thermoanaerobaculia bacterium]
MISTLRYVLLDVFADRPLAGNPLAVFPEASGLDDATLQLVAREMDHAATSFLFPATASGAAFRLRIFSREREIPFAGHPALGAHYVHAIETRRPLALPVTRVVHEGNDGLFEVDLVVENGQIGQLRLTQREPTIGPKLTSDEVADVAEALSLAEEEIQATNQPVRVASTGLPVLIVPVVTLSALFAARPRYDLLRGVLEGRDAMLVYAFTKETRDARSAAHARAFDTVGSVEVPGAGAAAGALAAYLVSHNAVTVQPVTVLPVEQGHAVNRPSTIYTEVHVADSEIVRVVMGGRVVRVGEGRLEL